MRENRRENKRERRERERGREKREREKSKGFLCQFLVCEGQQQIHFFLGATLSSPTRSHAWEDRTTTTTSHRYYSMTTFYYAILLLLGHLIPTSS